MRSRFPAPARITLTRFLASTAALPTHLQRRPAWVLFDSGVPALGELPARGLLRLEGGEGGKRWAELERVLSWLGENRAERGQALVVIGGGAVLDLGALAASLYRRGMPLVLVPTTLLGMVDATLGGKTAVDAVLGGRLRKNFAGTFYPAAEIWVCPAFLSSLPPAERLSGAGEVLKTLWIRGGKFSPDPLVRFVRDGAVSPALGRLIKECLALKARVVERDPLDEKRVREVLNFGHTVGHALESASGLPHGECVLWGMAVETRLLGRAGARMGREIEAALALLGTRAPAEFASLSEAEWLELLGADKKTKGGKIELSLLSAPGKIVRKRVNPLAVARAIAEFGRG